MGTRSIVAKPNGDGWFGRYCHWDGYPSGVGVSLLAGCEMLGYDALIKKLVDDELVGWSVLAGSDLALEPCWDRDNYNAPQSYTARGEVNDCGPLGYHFTESSDDFGGAEWLYIMAPAGIFVAAGDFGAFGMGGGNFRDLTLVPWGDHEAMLRLEEVGADA